MSRRLFWPIAIVLMAAALVDCRRPLLAEDDWQRYRTTFIAPEGRVVDSGNGGISHSEGQGYGMLLALEAGDQTTFQRLWEWTRQNLQVRQDNLFVWKFVPGQGVVDDNNATDGDILIAWALLRAADRWDGEYAKRGRQVLVDIRNKLVRRWGDERILLPGEQGFAHGGRLTVNLSYWIFPAFDDFMRHDPSPIWEELTRAGLTLQAKARYGRWRLPPDWLDLEKGMAVAASRPPFFGYDAVRIPLYLFWAGKMTAEQAALFLKFRSDSLLEKGFLSPQANLNTNELANYEASAGIKKVYQLLDSFSCDKGKNHAALLTGTEDYYSATLVLLSQLAAREGGRNR